MSVCLPVFTKGGFQEERGVVIGAGLKKTSYIKI